MAGMESVGKDMLKHANFQYADKTDTHTHTHVDTHTHKLTQCVCEWDSLCYMHACTGEMFNWNAFGLKGWLASTSPPLLPYLSPVPSLPAATLRPGIRWNCRIVLKCDVGFACLCSGRAAFGIISRFLTTSTLTTSPRKVAKLISFRLLSDFDLCI